METRNGWSVYCKQGLTVTVQLLGAGCLVQLSSLSRWSLHCMVKLKMLWHMTDRLFSCVLSPLPLPPSLIYFSKINFLIFEILTVLSIFVWPLLLYWWNSRGDRKWDQRERKRGRHTTKGQQVWLEPWAAACFLLLYTLLNNQLTSD